MKLSEFTKQFATRSWIIVIGIWLTLMAFNILWCMMTTFRAMSFVDLYINNLLLACVLALPTLWIRRNWYAIILFIIVDCILIANLMYCRTYYGPIPLQSYGLAGNLADFGPSVVESFRWYDLILPLIGIISLSAANKFCKPSDKVSYILSTVVLVIISGITMLCRGGFRSHYDKLESECYYNTCRVPVYTVAGQLTREAIKKAEIPSPEQIEFVSTFRDILPPNNILSDSILSPKSIILVICESLESWVIGTEILGNKITPNLDKLIKEQNTLFIPNMLTQVNEGRSIDCQLLLNTGLLPPANSVWSMNHSDHEYPSLTKAVKAIRPGGRSYILTCDKPTVWNQARVAETLGYDTLLCANDWKIDEKIGNPPKLSDGSFIRQIVEKMSTGEIWPVGESGFLQIVTYSGHSPFRLPDQIEHLPTPENWPERLRNYIATAHYTDSALGTLIDYLKTRPDFDSTLIVITGDHEGLGVDRDYFNQVSDGIVSDGYFTPLIIANMPVMPESVPDLIGQCDVYPTLLQLLGLTDYTWPGLGKSIFDKDHPNAALHISTGTIYGEHNDSIDRKLTDAAKVSHLIITKGL